MPDAITLIVTLLDLPVILDILREALDAVPEWERQGLYERLQIVLARAQRARRRT